MLYTEYLLQTRCMVVMESWSLGPKFCTPHVHLLYTSLYTSCQQVINEAGTLAVVEDEDALLWVIDLKSKQFLHQLTIANTSPDDYTLNLYEAVITLDGENIVLNISREYEELSSGYLTCPSVWNLRSGTHCVTLAL